MQPGVNTLIHCFVDFVSPLHAAAAMDALQGEFHTLFFLPHNYDCSIYNKSEY